MTGRPVVALDGVRPDEVHVVRVFADAHGQHGNELGIVLASARTDGREAGIARELPFAGHPTVGAAWWLASCGVAVADATVDHLYAWAWIDEAAGAIRSRTGAPALGIAEDEATGSAALRITAHLGRDLRITQGRGSELVTRLLADGRAEVGGRTVADRVVPLP
ncbi:PhzF family phenazine biosynthesis protein [Clavibacter sp. CT19]|uniref:PhzF family phenazine biosynthesis protein n=1 Tax=unclassified Clavibacter TaxID=2626594 RepID=UPI0022EAED8B|nr:PhzF family phenazine biosynthesis protein [Clavibacter sp. CT19]MDA3804065.1 PhzF family phenazine biosynthesis protein [Clavibacter sp. CT19]